ncbi:MAG: ABC transporter ATP-binding protein [Planctomycetota bacterium]|jgi:putative ABC transport system ATP-binding protein
MKSAERPLLECRKVWKIYNEGTPAEVRAIQDVNIKIKRGEFVAIQGPSGSGKSTLLHCIGCLDTPTRGKIFIGGDDTSKMSQDQLALIRRKKIGFVFQFFNIIPTLTALQNVELPMVFNNMDEAARRRKAKQLLEKVGLGKRINHKSSELSGGETQRVAIARALANDPIIVFADEPTGNLDSKSGREVIDIFTKLNKEGRTVAVITHDAYVARYAKRKIRLKDGMIIK